MASKILSKDLAILKQRYKNKMNYFDKKIMNNTDPTKEKQLITQYEHCVRAYNEIKIIIATHERIYG